MFAALFLLLFVLAFANGANDSCKGVAALVGCGAAKPRAALLWATVTTALGALLSFWLAGGLLRSFSTGLFAPGTPLDTPFFVAVLAGAAGWVLLATGTGLPVSTTHAITGALTGAGLVAFGDRAFQWSFLGAKFALPLALSPLASLLLVYLASWPLAWAARRVADRCLCLREELQPRWVDAAGAAAASARLSVVVDADAACAEPAPLLAARGSRIADGLHWLAGGLVGVARGWNDAPKIAALGLVALPGPGGMALAFLVVTVAMAFGGLLFGRRVLETLATKVTPLPLAESLAASLATAALVGMASWNGLPVSTTHVATGAILGAGVRHDPGAVRWSKVGEILLSWLVTLPVAALLAAAAKLLVR